MMISPEAYYENELKGKTEKEIRTAIRGLQIEIGRLKKVMEHPDYKNNGVFVDPAEDVMIWCGREYLERAKLALVDLGATYVPSKAEQKEIKFQENIKHIKEIIFEIPEGKACRTYILVFDGEVIKFESQKFCEETVSGILDKEEFVAALEELHIGEWKSYYDARKVGGTIKSCENWWVVFEYENNIRRVSLGGNNAFPYNFDNFVELFRSADLKSDEDERLE